MDEDVLISTEGKIAAMDDDSKNVDKVKEEEETEEKVTSSSSPVAVVVGGDDDGDGGQQLSPKMERGLGFSIAQIMGFNSAKGKEEKDTKAEDEDAHHQPLSKLWRPQPFREAAPPDAAAMALRPAGRARNDPLTPAR